MEKISKKNFPEKITMQHICEEQRTFSSIFFPFFSKWKNKGLDIGKGK